MTSVARRYGHQGSPFERPSGEGAVSHGAPVVLMVSGGADSSALLYLAATSTLDIEDGRGDARIGRERLHVLHVNHLARGIDSQEDEEFVVELAARFGIPCTVVREDVPALAEARRGHSFEEVARDVRYEAARQLANELSEAAGTRRGDARIVTAHTADDRVETFFMNAIRGSGPSGLSSIPRRRNRVVRPLLDRTHRELCDLLRMHGIIWREDDTNADPRHLRNYVRARIVPPARERNPRLVRALSTTCDLLNDEDAYLTGVAARSLRSALVAEEDGARLLDAAKVALMDVAVARRVVRMAIEEAEPLSRLEARHVHAVLRLVAAGSGSTTTPLGVDVSVDRGILAIRARRARHGLGPDWLPVPGELTVAEGLRIEARVRPVATLGDPVAAARVFGLEHEGRAVMLDARSAGVDVGAEASRLWVAPARAGELLRPLGMDGRSKRLSDLLAEAGVPARERPRVPVVRTEPGGRIVWVCGVRADERSRVTESTKTLVVLRLAGSVPWLAG